MQTDTQDVIGAAVAGNHGSRLAPPHGLLLPAAGELVEGRFERPFVYFLTRVCFFTAAKAAVAGMPRWVFWNSRIFADKLKSSLFLAVR